MPVEDVTNEYLTPQEAADQKGVALATIYKAIERGLLPSSRVLNRVALRASDVAAYQPGSYGEKKRTYKARGPGRPAAGTDKETETSE